MENKALSDGRQPVAKGARNVHVGTLRGGCGTRSGRSGVLRAAPSGEDGIIV